MPGQQGRLRGLQRKLLAAEATINLALQIGWLYHQILKLFLALHRAFSGEQGQLTVDLGDKGLTKGLIVRVILGLEVLNHVFICQSADNDVVAWVGQGRLRLGVGVGIVVAPHKVDVVSVHNRLSLSLRQGFRLLQLAGIRGFTRDHFY